MNSVEITIKANSAQAKAAAEQTAAAFEAMGSRIQGSNPAVQQMADAFAGVGRETKSAADSAAVFTAEAKRLAAAQEAAAAEASAMAGRVQGVVNAFAGVDQQAKAAADSASVFAAAMGEPLDQQAQLVARLRDLQGIENAAAGPVAGMERLSLATAGARRELIVLAHEALTGRWTRVGPSLMVLAERMGGVSLAAVGMAGAIAAAGFAAYEMVARTEALDEALARASAALENQGRAGTIGAQQLSGYVDQLDRLHGVSASAAESIIVSWSEVSSVTPQIFEGLTKSLEGYIVLTGQKAPAAAEQLAAAIDDPIRGLDELARRHVYVSAEAVALIGTLEREGDVMQARRVMVDALSTAMQQAADTGLTPFQKATREVHDALRNMGDAVSGAQSQSVTLAYGMHGLAVAIGYLRGPIWIVTKAFFDMADVADTAFQGIRAGIDSVVSAMAPASAALSSMWKAAGDAVHGDFSAAGGDLLRLPDDMKARYQAAAAGVHDSFRRILADMKDMVSSPLPAPKVPPVPTMTGLGAEAGAEGMTATEQAMRLNTVLNQVLTKRRDLLQIGRDEALIRGRMAQLEQAQLTGTESQRAQIGAQLSELREALAIEEKRREAAEKTEGGGAPKDRMSGWQTQLANQLAAGDGVRAHELAATVAYWRQIEAAGHLSAQEQQSVARALAEAKLELTRRNATASAEAARKAAEEGRRAAEQAISYDREVVSSSAKGSAERIAAAEDEVKRAAALYGRQSAEYARAQHDMTQAQQQAQDARNGAVLAKLNSSREAALGEIALEKQAIEQRAGMKGAADAADLARLRTLLDQEYRLKVQAIQDELNLKRMSDQQIGALGDQLTKLQQKHALDRQKIDEQASKASVQQWQNALKPISSAFDTSIKGIIQGTQTLQQAMNRAAQSILLSWVGMAEQKLTDWIATELGMTAATMAGTAARTGSETAADAAATAAHAATAKTSVMQNAYSAAAAVYNDVAQIPYVGWVLAPPAAAAAFAAVAAYSIAIPSAAGGYDVPADTLAMIHQNEVVLPADLANKFRAGGNAISGQGAGGSVVNSHFSPTLNFTAQGRMTADEIVQHADTIVSVLKRAHRNGAFAGARS